MRPAFPGFCVAPLLLVVLLALSQCRPAAQDPAPALRDADETEPVATNLVTMRDTAFDPPAIQVEIGARVRWRNQSNLTHTVTTSKMRVADPANVQSPPAAPTFHSGGIAPGQEYTRVFLVPGFYRYVCTEHEGAGMAGTILVQRR